MKQFLKYIMASAVFMLSFATYSMAGDDYVTIYSSWDKILYDEPDTVLTQVTIEISSPYCINIKSIHGKDKVAKDILKNQALAVAVNDSVWFVNTNFLKKNYTGFALPYMSNYAPLYFNDKIAYTQYTNDIDNSFLYELSNNVVQGMSTTEALKFLTSYGFNFENAYIFLIDPHTKRVDALNDAKMSQLLQPYLDLRKRYESMYFYNEPFVINYFFLEYIDRIDQDPFMKSLVE